MFLIHSIELKCNQKTLHVYHNIVCISGLSFIFWYIIDIYLRTKKDYRNQLVLNSILHKTHSRGKCVYLGMFSGKRKRYKNNLSHIDGSLRCACSIVGISGVSLSLTAIEFSLVITHADFFKVVRV